jgi:hypothetical protein
VGLYDSVDECVIYLISILHNHPHLQNRSHATFKLTLFKKEGNIPKKVNSHFGVYLKKYLDPFSPRIRGKINEISYLVE